MRSMRMPGGARLRADAQAEISAERESGELEPVHGKERLQPRDGADDLGQAAGVEELAVERMRAAVVAQVEAHDVVAARVTVAARPRARRASRRSLPSRA
jgi:hypothetical protein